jgi:hypothetical protein
MAGLFLSFSLAKKRSKRNRHEGKNRGLQLKSVGKGGMTAAAYAAGI